IRINGLVPTAFGYLADIKFVDSSFLGIIRFSFFVEKSSPINVCEEFFSLFEFLRGHLALVFAPPVLLVLGSSEVLVVSASLCPWSVVRARGVAHRSVIPRREQRLILSTLMIFCLGCGLCRGTAVVGGTGVSVPRAAPRTVYVTARDSCR